MNFPSLPFARSFAAVLLYVLMGLSTWAVPPPDGGPEAEALGGLEVVASDAAEKRAVLRHADELVLIRPGDPLPGIDGSEVESISPRWIVARLDATRQVWISTGDDGEIRVLDRRAPERPPVSEPVWILPSSGERETAESAEEGGAP